MERLQPYNSGDSPNYLSILRTLNNSDKHRRLSLFVSTMDFQFGISNLNEGAKIFIECVSRNPSESDAPLIRIGGITNQVNVQANPSLSVFFEEGPQIIKGLPLIRTLDPIFEQVKLVVEEFNQFF